MTNPNMTCVACMKQAVYIEPRFGYAVCSVHMDTPPIEIGALRMKQFTEAELEKLLDEQYDLGYAAGFANGVKANTIAIGAKSANQRRELRRLNKQLELMYKGAAAMCREEANPFAVKTH